MGKPIKKDATYDGRTEAGRQSVGKPLHPTKTATQMEKALKNTKKSGK